MSEPDSTPLNHAAPQAGKPPWTAQSCQLSTAWLTSFAGAVSALNREGLARMFHPCAAVFGGYEFGPCDQYDALQFAFALGEAKFAPLDRAYTLIAVPWIIKPVLAGSPPVLGDATFVLCAQAPVYREDGALAVKGFVVCIHAHYSRRMMARTPPTLVKAAHLFRPRQ